MKNEGIIKELGPVAFYEHVPTDRREPIQFYESQLGQAIHSWRSKSIEPLIEHIKSVFRIDQLQVRSYQKDAGIVPLSGTTISNPRLLQL